MSTSSPTSSVDAATRATVEQLLELAPRGLHAAHRAVSGEFSQTVRGVRGLSHVRLQAEGKSLRYAAIAALGLERLPVEQQRHVLSGRTAGEIAATAGARAMDTDDVGAVALAAWAEAEVNSVFSDKLFGRLRDALDSDRHLPTVDVAWLVTAASSASRLGNTDELLVRGAASLVGHQGPGGTWAHRLPTSSLPRWRSHVGSFADQVYPLQALARASLVTGEWVWREAADRTAATLVAHQGPAGQWWWHYDVRDGSVVETYPVYSVHQHAMAPMVLFDLLDAGGADHRAAVQRGVGWLDRHPEVVEELISERLGLVWRKVGRREPRKAVRGVNAITTSVRPGLRLPGLDRAFPPRLVDHECRPYELGWLLYAWAPGPTSGAGLLSRVEDTEGADR